MKTNTSFASLVLFVVVVIGAGVGYATYRGSGSQIAGVVPSSVIETMLLGGMSGLVASVGSGMEPESSVTRNGDHKEATLNR
jgi:hypothetical protein